jgi:mannosyltransferase
MNLYLDDIIFYLQDFGGISVYWNELAKNMLNSQDFEARFIEPPGCQPRFKEAVVIPEELVVHDRKLPIKILRYLPVNSKKIVTDSLLHSSYFRFSTGKKTKNIITVYDFTYERFMRGLAKIVHCRQKGLAIKHAAGIICISENTRKDLLHFYPDAAAKLIKVIYLSASESFKKIKDLDILNTRFSNLKDKKIIPFVGKRVGYKNFEVAVEVIKRLPDDYHLLVAGGGELTKEEKTALASCPHKFTQELGVGQEELNVIYNLSFCYLYPSGYEGFGIPVLEAMRAGCPVVCQNMSSIPEVYGNVENIVKNVNDIDEFCVNILKLEDTVYRKKVIDQGIENAKRFSWQKTSQETLEFYRSVCNLTP